MPITLGVGFSFFWAFSSLPVFMIPVIDFYTVPQEKLDDRSIFMSRGKVLGGSSAINLMGIALAGAVEYDRQ